MQMSPLEVYQKGAYLMANINHPSKTQTEEWSISTNILGIVWTSPMENPIAVK